MITLFKCKYGCCIRRRRDGERIFHSFDPTALDFWPVTWIQSLIFDDVYSAEYP